MQHHICTNGNHRSFPSNNCGVCHGAGQDIDGPDKSWRLEVNNPQEPADWRLLWEFGDDEYAAHLELADELNQINAPIQVRLIPDE